MGFLNDIFELDALALNMLTMIGLALGVDYSLLIVSRFREELANGLSVQEAVEQSVARAGRTVLFAGAALSTGMLGALLIAPGNLLVSATLGVIVACTLAVTMALFAIPAGLALVGHNVNRWTFWRSDKRNWWVVFSERMSSKPGLAMLLTLIPLLLLSAPALALNTGPPSVANLPPDNSARKSYEAFERDRGAGWATPYEVVFHTKGPITTQKRLRALKRFQLQAAQIDGVQAVLGPASLLDRTAVLRQLTQQVAEGGQQLNRLERGLRRLLLGNDKLTNGLQKASNGSQQLSSGLDQAASGSDQIAQGVAGAAPGAQQLAAGVEAADSGAGRINSNTKRAASGSKQLDDAIQELADSLSSENKSADSELIQPTNAAQSALQAALRDFSDASPEAQADPNIVKAKQDVQSALTSLGTLKTNITDSTTTLDTNAVAAREIARNMGRLTSGLGQLATGTTSLDNGLGDAAAGAAGLASGVNQLTFGTSELSTGLNQLAGTGDTGGARELADALDLLTAGSNQIGRGLRRLFDGVVAVRETSQAQRAELRRQGTDVRKASTSGFFVLAGIEGAKAQSQTNASFAVNTPNGGNTSRVIVIPEAGPFDPKSAQIEPELKRLASQTANQINAEEVVGGPAVLLSDFDKATTARFPWLVITLVLVTFLVLLVLFRAPILALCAVLLNLVTVGAAVGVLIICFQWNESIVGGPGYLDAIALSGIFAIIFGLSIDYEVFLLSRLVEGRAKTGTTEGAIRYGLEKTATIITGAAAVMAFVFIAFAISPVANTRQFGIGLTVAVVLDATVVRLILLPALIRFFGEKTWAVPPWLDRILPRFSTH